MTGGLEKLVATAGKKTLERIGQQIGSFSSFEKMREAVEANHATLMDAVFVFAAAGEEEFRKRTGRGYDDSTPEEVARFQRLLAGAHVAAADEIDPERIRLLAAAVVGVTWGDVPDQIRSVAWRAIKRLEPAGVSVLCSLLKDEKRKELGVPEGYALLVANERNAPEWLSALEGLGCLRTEYTRNKYLASTGMPQTTASLDIESHPVVTSIGFAVIGLLRGYLEQPMKAQQSKKDTEQTDIEFL
jgi:hypothetical protein